LGQCPAADALLALMANDEQMTEMDFALFFAVRERRHSDH
jgi:hypothetical protein